MKINVCWVAFCHGQAQRSAGGRALEPIVSAPCARKRRIIAGRYGLMSYVRLFGQLGAGCCKCRMRRGHRAQEALHQCLHGCSSTCSAGHSKSTTPACPLLLRNLHLSNTSSITCHGNRRPQQLLLPENNTSRGTALRHQAYGHADLTVHHALFFCPPQSRKIYSLRLF